MLARKAKLRWTSIKNVNEMSGKYETTFYVDATQQEKLKNAIDAEWNSYKGSFKGKPQSLGYTMVQDDNGAETGEIKFKATQAPQATDGKYTFEVDCYDADARKIEKDNIPNIGNGTIANVEFELYPYTFKTTNKGVKLQLKRIQITKLEEYTTGDANPFEKEEGFQAEPENPFESERPAGL